MHKPDCGVFYAVHSPADTAKIEVQGILLMTARQPLSLEGNCDAKCGLR